MPVIGRSKRPADPGDSFNIPFESLTRDRGDSAHGCGFRNCHLGAPTRWGNWSANLTIKQDHTLIRTGPYAIVRHPIYSGITLAAAGLVVLNGDLAALAGLVLMLLR